MSKIPTLYERVQDKLRRTGCADFSGQPFVNLREFGSSRIMRELNLSYVQIDSIGGLQLQPNLRTFIANGSSILSLKNFGAMPNVESVSMKETPVATDPNFVTALLVICPHVAVVNGKMVGGRIKHRAKQYPSVAARLIDAGWMPEYPCPDEETLKQLCHDFVVPWTDEGEVTEVQCSDPDEDRFEEALNKIYSQQARIVSFARRFCGLEVDEEEEDALSAPSSPSSEVQPSDGTEPEAEQEVESAETEEARERQPQLLDKIAQVLMDSGIEVKEEEMHSSVMKIIDTLCQRREKAQGQSDV